MFRGRMKFSRVRDVKKAFLPVHVLNWMFGFGIVEFPFGRPRKLFSICWSVIQFFIALSVLIIIETSSILNIRYSPLTGQNYKIYIYGNFGLLVVCLIIGRLKAKFQDEYEKMSIQINTNLIRLGIPNEYDVVFKSQLLELSVVFIGLVVMFATASIYLSYYFTSTTNCVGFQIIVQYFGLVPFVVDFSFRIGVGYFKNRFRHLNMYLVKSSQQLKSDRNIRHSNVDVLTNSTVAFEYSRDLRLLKATEGQWMAYVVREVRKIHHEICQSVNLFTDFYTFQMLFSFLINFVLITTLSYSVYLALSSSAIEFSDKVSRDPLAFFAIVWISLYCGRLFVIVHVCSTTSNEAHKIGKIIYRLSNQITDQRVRDEIHTFSLQLLQNPLAFKMYGFFTLDYAFFRSVIGSVTTFLVILIQMSNLYVTPTD